MAIIHLDSTTVYRRHNCKRRHRTTRTFMKCAIPRAAWVWGDGEYALIAWCGVPTVMLHETLERAEWSEEQIDRYGCGSKCDGKHVIVRVELQGNS